MHTVLRPRDLRVVYAAAWLFGTAMVMGCGHEPPGPLVGTWVDQTTAEMDSSGMSLTYRFDRDGTLAIAWRRPLLSDTVLTADYEVQWDSVLTLSDERGTEQFIAHVLGNTLTLRSEDGIIQRYARQSE